MTASKRRRLVLELCHCSADPRTIRLAAQFASSLDLDLHGVFIEDTSVLALAGLPFVREIRLPTHEWQAIDAERMQAELRHAATTAQRTLHDIAAAAGVANAFEVLRGEPGETFSAMLARGDIVAIAAPSHAGARLAPGFVRLHAAAHVSSASVLLLPLGHLPAPGPVVAILAGADDPALALAAQLAVSAKQPLTMFLPRDSAPVTPDVTGMPRSHVTMRRLAGLQAADVLHALGHAHESLIVLTRGASPVGSVEGASQLSADLGVPVLLAEPDQP